MNAWRRVTGQLVEKLRGVVPEAKAEPVALFHAAIAEGLPPAWAKILHDHHAGVGAKERAAIIANARDIRDRLGAAQQTIEGLGISDRFSAHTVLTGGKTAQDIANEILLAAAEADEAITIDTTVSAPRDSRNSAQADTVYARRAQQGRAAQAPQQDHE